MQTAQRSAKRIQLTPVRRFTQSESTAHIVVHTTNFIELLRPDEIQYVRAESNYCSFVMKDNSQCLSSKTLGSYEEQLLACGFIRPHQSYVVNAQCVRRIRKSGGYSLCMSDGTELPIARSRRKQIVEELIQYSL